MQVRLNKFLAEKGVASRRKADDLITAGKIHVNGKIVRELGTQVDPQKDRVEVDEKVLADRPKLVYFMLNKPAGFVCSNSKTKAEPRIVLDLFPSELKIFPVGRLDKATTGLLILTNDGNLSFRLTHPKFECEKEYEVEVGSDLTKERVRKIESGIPLDHKKTKPTEVKVLDKRKALVILREGRNRQVRKIFGKVGCEVLRLKRLRIKNLRLGDLPLGQFRELTPGEVKMLYDA
ncbi:MAG: rRNA pseudouridine synthase [Candidatus Peribacteraceae bacterium]|nr:rRNA pseudouridine synthase [Candidatus Peribacteraceae bacterium]